MPKNNFNFSTLTPDTIWNSLSKIGIRAESGFLALNSYENRVYQFSDENKHRYVVKFYRPNRWTKEQILEEHFFANQLAEQEIPIALPININGETLHSSNGYYFSLFNSLGGRSFEVDNLDQLEWVGQYLGRIHKVGESELFSYRPTINLDEYLYQPQKLLENSTFIPSYLENSFFSDLKLLIANIEDKWTSSYPIIRLHGDCHPSNILWRDKPLFVDLDDARNGPAIQDLWMLLNGKRQDKLIQLDILLEAYTKYCDFNQNQLELIEPLRSLRMVYYMAWLAKRWSDPAFPIAFPWFSDKKYWENQILSFKEQISALNETPLKLMPQW